MDKNCISFGCYFCERSIKPSYKEIDVLKRFLKNGEVQSVRKTECCAKHQLQLKEEVKKAKQIALLPM